MPRNQMAQWNLHFGIRLNETGYSWQQMPRELIGVDRGSDPGPYLAPNRGDGGSEADKSTTHGERSVVMRNGRGVALKAYREFKKLASELVEHPIPQSNIEGAFPEKNQEQSIIRFANDYGTLWGDHDPRSLREWRLAAAEFLDLLDVSKALVSGNFREFDKRVGYVKGHSNVLSYSGRYFLSRPMTIVQDRNVMTLKRAPNALEQEIDFWKKAKEGSSWVRAQMLFNGRINRNLAGGMSLGLPVLNFDEAFIAPHHLIHLLYARMWLDTVNGESMERRVTCANTDCGREIRSNKPGSVHKRRKYCSDECRWEVNNRRRAALK